MIRCRSIVASLLVLLVAPLSLADTFEWIDPVSGLFNVEGNWKNTTGVDLPPPNAGDQITFNEAGAYTVTFKQDEAGDRFTVADGVVTFASDSATVRQFDLITGTADALVRGGTLNIGSTTKPVFVNVGEEMNIGTGTGSGTVVLSGASSRLDVLGTGFSHVGSSGFTGDLTVKSGATANFGTGGTLRLGISGISTTQGTVLVDGAGSTLNTGHVEIAAVDSLATGTMSVTGSGSSVNQILGGATLTLGSATTGTGTITVQDGGTFTTGSGTTTINATGTLSITDGTFNANGPLTMSAGSTLTLDGDAINAMAGLDNTAEGTLDFRDGTLTVTDGAFSPNAAGPGDHYRIDGPTATELPHLVIGAGATANIGGDNDLSVGFLQRGKLTISGGGVVSNRFGVIGSEVNSTGTVIVDGAGSTWTNLSDLFIGGTLFSLGGSGTLIINNGGTVFARGSSIGFISSGITSTVTVTGMGSTWTNSAGLSVGIEGDGALNIKDRGAVSNLFGTIGDDAGSTGTVTIEGIGSTWTNSSFLIVGSLGNGTLNIQNGGAVSSIFGFVGGSNGSTGTVTVDGAGSTWTNSADLFVGGNSSAAGGTGNLNVQDQGLVEVAGVLKIWDSGTVNLFGGTISLVNSTSLDGDAGTFTFASGVLELRADSAITPSFTGDALGGSAIGFGRELRVLGEATLFTGLSISGGTLTAGSLSPASLVQLDSGTLHVTNQAIAIEPAGPLGDVLDLAANMTVIVDLGLTNNGLVTGDGTIGGSFTNNADGEVQGLAGNNLVLTGSGITNNGQVTLSGGQVHFTQDVSNSATGLVIGNGTLRADGGVTNDGDMALSATANIIGNVTNNASGLIISAGGTTTFFDDVTNSGEIRTSQNSFTVYFGSYSGNGDTGVGGTVIMEGDLKPGSSPGLMAFGGDLGFGNQATLQSELGGLVAGSEFDQVNVADAVSLGGTLSVELIGGFMPDLGDTFDILTANGGVNGEFATTLFPDLGVLVAMDVFYVTNTVTLAVVPALAGDYNANGIVDAADYTVWRDTLGQSGVGLAADGNRDHMITQEDYDFWKAHFGATLGGGSNEAITAPEPASGLLALSLIAILCQQWYRRTRRVLSTHERVERVNTRRSRDGAPGLATMSLPRVRRQVETHLPSAAPDRSAIRAFSVLQLTPYLFLAPS